MPGEEPDERSMRASTEYGDDAQCKMSPLEVGEGFSKQTLVSSSSVRFRENEKRRLPQGRRRLRVWGRSRARPFDHLRVVGASAFHQSAGSGTPPATQWGRGPDAGQVKRRYRPTLTAA